MSTACLENILDNIGSSDDDEVDIVQTGSSERVSRRDYMSSQREEVNFLHDDPADMTYSRRIALHLMNRYSWYNPRLDEDRAVGGNGVLDGEESGGTMSNPEASAGGGGRYVEMDEISRTGSVSSFNRSVLGRNVAEERPSLEKAWAYFEHVTLPRFLHRPGDVHLNRKAFCSRLRRTVRMLLRGDEQTMDVAEPGEDRYPTKLYSPLWTPINQMGDFGLGVGLYFSALRFVTFITLLAGMLNIPNMVFFAGEQYSNHQEGVSFTLRGFSAVCTDQDWVPCPTCDLDDFAQAQGRIATYSSIYDDEALIFAKKNNCDGAKLSVGLVNYATLLVIIVGMLFLNMHLKKKEVMFDEDEQTAQDYSVVIKNPPPDATEPAEWKEFFESEFGGAHVTCCTVALDNDALVQSLVRRRETLQRLKLMLPPGTSLNVANLSEISRAEESGRSLVSWAKAMVVPGVPEVYAKLLKINLKIRDLSLLQYPAARVFVTFETEEAQRRVLSSLCRGSRAAGGKDTNKTQHMFRSSVVLRCKEADEPSTVRWHDLSNNFLDRALRIVLTTYVWACSMALVGFIIRLCRSRSAVFSAFAISGFNAAFPEFAKLLTNFESHASEDRRQTSLYIKIAAFRWINTAIIITMITPFTSTLSDGDDNILSGVKAIFFAEIVTTNAIKFADPMGFVHRHILAPRASTQESMNAHMRGDEYNLAERYTNMTKIVFLALWYSAIYPGALFLCAVTNIINYYADRFSLMRTWKQAPRVGPRISSFCRRYFFTTVISAMAIASSYAWTGFPYDNLCQNDDGDDGQSIDDYIGSWTITTADGSTTEEVTVSNGDPSYRFCLQDLMRYGHGFNFPALPRFQTEGDEWMTEEQATLTSIYGWTSLCIVAGVILWIIWRIIYVFFVRGGTYQAVGEDQGINFSDVPSISSYVPEVRTKAFPYPLLAVKTEGVYEELYEWKDPDKPYSYYDLTRDVDEVLKDTLVTDAETGKLFSSIDHWSPYNVNDKTMESQRMDLSQSQDRNAPLKGGEEQDLQAHSENEVISHRRSVGHHLVRDLLSPVSTFTKWRRRKRDVVSHTATPLIDVGESGAAEVVHRMNSAEIMSSETETEVVPMESDTSGVLC